MPAYIIGNYTVHDQEKIEKYRNAARPLILQYGGKLLVADTDAKLKGCPHQVMVVIEFDSVEAARRFDESPEYGAIRHYREEASEGWGGIFPGFVMPRD